MFKRIHDKLKCLNRLFPHSNSNYPPTIAVSYIDKGILFYTGAEILRNS
jgi:hypothetical protein